MSSPILILIGLVLLDWMGNGRQGLEETEDRREKTEVGCQISETRWEKREGAPVKQKRQISRGKYITGRGKQRAKGGK